MVLNQSLGWLAVPWTRAFRHAHDVPVTINKEGHRRASDPVRLGDFVLGVQGHRILDVMRLDKLVQLFILHAVERNPNQDKTLFVEGIIEMFERGPLSCAVGSPRGPEIKQYEFPL